MKKIIIPFMVLAIASNVFAAKHEYPKSKMEKEREEMGSLAGGEGVVFRPSKVKSTSTKAVIGNVNAYLYKAALDVLSFTPIATADSKTGVVITEWYSPKESPKSQFKVNVLIKDNVISAEALEVRAFERTKRGSKWSDDPKESSLSSVFEDKILRKARDLYIAESSKKK